MLTFDRYITAKTLGEAFTALESTAGARLVAGATDLLPWAREGRAGDVHLPALVDVSGIPELCDISLEGDRLHIGAATPIAAFEQHPLLVANAQLLARCAVWFADDQIREQASLGGNVVNASPAGDTFPALLAMNAHVVLVRRDAQGMHQRTLPVSDFVRGPGNTLLGENEILLRIDCDAVPEHGCAFEKVGHRRSLVISTVCLAVLTRLDSVGEELEDVRIAIGAVGPVPERLSDAEVFLLGKQPTAEILREAAEMAVDHVRSRSRQEYRRDVLVNFVERGLATALQQSGLEIARLPKELSYV